MREKLSARQTGVLAGILIFANKILVLPSLMFQYTKGDTLLIVLMLFLFDLFSLFIFFKLKDKYKDMSFFEILSKKLTKPIAIIIFTLLISYLFVEVMLNFHATRLYFKSQVYHEDQKFLYLVILLVVFASTSMRGLTSLGRTLGLLFYVVIAGFLFCQFISLFNFKESLIIFDTSINNFFTGVYKHVFSFGDLLSLFLLMDKIECEKKERKEIVLNVILSMLLVVIGYFLFLSIFQNTGFMHTNAVSDVIVLSQEIFDLGRVDIIAVITIMLLAFSQVSIYGYIIINSVISIFPKLKKSIAVAIVVFIILFLYFFVFNNFDSVIAVSSSVYGASIAILLQYILPWICGLFTFGGGKDEKNN